MVDTLTHESTNGISRTTVTLEMQGGIEIQIDHYDTHPHSFNIELAGSPAAVLAMSAHLPSLLSNLEKRLPTFEIRLLSPVIKANSKKRIDKLKKSRDKN